MKVGVLALQGAVGEHVAALTDLGAHAVEVRTPADLAALDALVLPGGESTTMSLLLESSGLFDEVASRLGEGMPAFGTCAGMILLARHVVDGRPDQRSFRVLDAVVRRNGFGRQVDSFEADLDVEGLGGGPFPGVFIRAPVVEQVGDGIDVLARVDGRPALVRQGRTFASAFHPELAGDLRIHRLFLDHLEN